MVCWVISTSIAEEIHGEKGGLEQTVWSKLAEQGLLGSVLGKWTAVRRRRGRDHVVMERWAALVLDPISPRGDIRRLPAPGGSAEQKAAHIPDHRRHQDLGFASSRRISR